MKKRVQGLVAGMLMGAMLTSGMAFSKQISETAQLFYNNIKIYIDGGEIVPKDANGNIVEPFTMNGTTYLPVRAISNVFGKDVEWDGATQSIYIGEKDHTKPDNYLDRIQYTYFGERKAWSNIYRNNFYRINGRISDYNDKIYTNGMLFYVVRGNSGENYVIENDVDNANVLIDYPLNSSYSYISGKVVLPKEINTTIETNKGINTSGQNFDVLFFGDGKLLTSTKSVNASMPFNFEADVNGVNTLTIKILLNKGFSGYVALTDLALYK